MFTRICTCLLLLATAAIAAIPHLVNYQGRIDDLAGNPVPNDTYTLKFELYTTASGGTAFWAETRTAVPVSGGVFNVLLGGVVPLDTIPLGPDCYLQTTVRFDAPVSPRSRIVSAPYCYRAEDADKLGGSPAASWQDWVHGGDSALYTIRQLGLARGGSANALRGGRVSTHANFGVACTTGEAGGADSFCTVSGGQGNRACSSYSTVGGGRRNQAGGRYSFVAGGNAAYATHTGEMAHASGCFYSPGDAQASQYVLRAQGAGDVTLTLDGAVPGAGNGLRHKINRTATYDILVTVNGNACAAGYRISCVVEDAGDNTFIVGSPTITTIADNSPGWFSTWVWVDNHSLWIGGHSTWEARWVASVRTAEVNW